MKLTRETNVALDALTHLARQPAGAIVGAAEACRLDRRLAGISFKDFTAVGRSAAYRRDARGRVAVRALRLWMYACSDVDPCPLHDVWKRVRPMVREEFTRLTIADLARRKVRRESAARKAASKPKRNGRRKKPATESA
jgi:DNA-binding IscR family transcriptional regulator